MTLFTRVSGLAEFSSRDQTNGVERLELTLGGGGRGAFASYMNGQILSPFWCWLSHGGM
jgi:hypothetical protein